MPSLPSASTTIEEAVGQASIGERLCTVLAPVRQNADMVPRIFGNVAALLEQHDFSEGADYVACHIQDTRLPVLFVGLPIDTPGALGRFNASGNTGTSVVSAAAGPDGCLTEHDGAVRVITGGTIGTDQILIEVSIDGLTYKRVKLGTGSSYTIPRIGVTLTFAAGTLVAGDTVLTWHGTAPKWASADLATARASLAAQSKVGRTWLLVGDVDNSTEAGAVRDQVNAYATENERDVRVRVNVRDRLPLASMSRQRVRMTGSPTLTFAEVGATGDTITRSSGSWLDDGFAVGDLLTITGSVSNNIVDAPIAAISATVITLGSVDLADEAGVANVVATATPAITFAEVGATGDTITRSRGSWFDDGFRVGDAITVVDTASNNLVDAVIASLTATVITLGADDLTAEVVGAYDIAITAGETMAAWVATMDAAFASIDGARRIDIGLGRARKRSPITDALMRRPAQWAVSLREYQHDVHIPTYRKADGALDGWSLEDEDGTTVEFDERIYSGGLAGRFTCLRSWANGPEGAFVALSLTRETEGSTLSRSHNADVAHVACNVGNSAAEDAIGQVLELDASGKPLASALNRIKLRVDNALKKELREDKGEGPRCSDVKWEPDPDVDLRVPGTVWPATLTLNLLGVVEQIRTGVRVS